MYTISQDNKLAVWDLDVDFSRTYYTYVDRQLTEVDLGDNCASNMEVSDGAIAVACSEGNGHIDVFRESDLLKLGSITGDSLHQEIGSEMAFRSDEGPNHAGVDYLIFNSVSGEAGSINVFEVLWKQGERYTYKFETMITWDVWT